MPRSAYSALHGVIKENFRQIEEIFYTIPLLILDH